MSVPQYTLPDTLYQAIIIGVIGATQSLDLTACYISTTALVHEHTCLLTYTSSNLANMNTHYSTAGITCNINFQMCTTYHEADHLDNQ